MQSNSDRKAALKQLRQARRESIKKATVTMKAQRKTVKAIQKTLTAGAATVPEIAGRINLPTDKALWFIATMKKYGQIVEDGKEGGYYRYIATQAEKNKENTGDHP